MVVVVVEAGAGAGEGSHSCVVNQVLGFLVEESRWKWKIEKEEDSLIATCGLDTCQSLWVSDRMKTLGSGATSLWGNVALRMNEGLAH